MENERMTAGSTLQPCPNCGKPIKKEAKFCPHCGNKVKVANFCSECGKEVEGGEKFCSDCGKNLVTTANLPPPPVMNTVSSSAPPSVPYSQFPPRTATMSRPLGIVLIGILWCIGGLINFFGGFSTLSSDLDAMSQGGYPYYSSWFSWALPAEAILSIVVLVVGVAQFATIYGLWTRKTWSYKYGLGIPLISVVVSWVLFSIYLTAPVNLEPSLLSPISSIVGAVIIASYIRQTHVKKWLKVIPETNYPNPI